MGKVWKSGGMVFLKGPKRRGKERTIMGLETLTVFSKGDAAHLAKTLKVTFTEVDEHAVDAIERETPKVTK